MLRILVGAETFPPDVNGAARFAGRLAEGLAGRGHEVHVVAPSPDGPARTEIVGGVTVHRVASRRYPSLDALRVCLPWVAARTVATVIADIQPDVVHTNGHLVLGRAVVNGARRSRLPLIATNHLMPENIVGYLPLPRMMHDSVGRRLWRDVGAVYRQADVVTAPTPRAVELLTTRAGLVGAHAVSNGIDIEHHQPRVHRHTDRPTMLFVGRLDAEKRVEELIRGLAGLPVGLNARLEVIGDGPQRAALTQLAERLEVTDHVVFRGRVSDEQLLRAYSRADVFCMPSIAELQSLATLEAMASGLPVVAADAMALPHLVDPGVTGFLYEPGRIDDLVTPLALLLGDADLRARLGVAGRRSAGRHAFSATLDTFEDFYLEQLDRGRTQMPDGLSA